MRTSSRGFTLIELAVVLVILAILGGALSVGLTAQLARRNELATDAAIDEARDALLGHLLRKGFFPCPARSASDGAEDRNNNICTRQAGLLPWATLGVTGLDGWGHRLRYAVTATYTQSITSVTDGNIAVRTRNSSGTELSLTTTGGLTPVVILSHGANGWGAVDQDGNALAAPPAGSDEALNAGGDGRSFFSRPLSENSSAPGGAFDDRVSWISPNLIAQRLASIGRLP